MEDSMDDTAKCFVPEMLVDFINKNMAAGKEGLEPSSFFLHGVCLLVDISGFTKLSGDFCGLGKGGIDELQLATNGYMGRLVEIIYTFGGEIIKFAGDAIICVFSSSYVTAVTQVSLKGKISKLRRSMSNISALFGSDDLLDIGIGGRTSPNSSKVKHFHVNTAVSADVVLRAMHCANQLREVQTEKLSVHVAMSCGEMCFGILGGVENRWECLISGSCIYELSSCLDDAPSKEAVITQDCADLLQQASIDCIDESAFENTMHDEGEASNKIINSTIVTEQGKYCYKLMALASGNHRIIHLDCAQHLDAFASQRCGALFGGIEARSVRRQDAKVVQLIRQFVPIPIAEQLDSSAGLSYIAEIREVTTMFMKWDSYDPANKHRDLLQLQAYFYEAQRILHSTGAYLRQFLVDDKGCVLIGCWGMPNMSYLDNSNRALSAAAQIRRKLTKMEMKCSFGITTGDVYCGTVGSALRMEYAAIGSVVNMSARLMCKANGGILIDDATYSRLPHNALDLLTALDPIKVKGRDDPLQVYSYVGNGSFHVKEKVVEDHEISAGCRDILLSLVGKMTAAPAKPAERPKKVRRGSLENVMKGWIAGITEGSSKKNTSVNPADMFTSKKLAIVLIKGKEGSGRTTVVKWLRKQALDRKIPVFSLRVGRKDSQVDYFIWKKLFQQLMPKGLFLSNEVQRSYVRALLNEVYPGAPQVGMHIGFPVLKAVLGITCSYAESPVADKKQHGWLSRKVVLSDKVLQPSQTLDALFRIFSYLLTVQTCLVVIENVELVDENSLKVLMELTKLVTRSAIVVTALEVAPEETMAFSTKSFFGNSAAKSFRHDAFNSAPWAKQYQESIQAHKATTTVTLENYTPEEIDQMLCATLKIAVVPPEISQLVQDFSGGSYFWVREILQFIKDHGSEQFMSAVGEQKDTQTHSIHLHPSIDTGVLSRPKMKPAPLQTQQSTMRRSPSMRQLTRTASLKAPSANRTASTPYQVQLDKLVLCRFGNLSSDFQRVLRTASIIGMTFSGVVLFGVLPQRLKEQMTECFQALLNQKWLYQDIDNESLYQFAHPHAHQIIYELTPSSERGHLHQVIADYIEETCGEDKTQYGPLSYHYQHCDTDKALRYCAKATNVLLNVDVIFDFGDCIDLLTGSIACCKSTYDVDILLKLVNHARNVVRTFPIGSMQVKNKATWMTTLMGALNAARRLRKVLPGNGGDDEVTTRSGSSHAYSVGTTSSFSTGSNDENDDHHVEAYSPHHGGSHSGTSAQDEVNFEKRTKRLLLQQLSRLYDQLSEKYVDIEDHVTSKGPAPWQKELLDLPPERIA